MHHLSALKIISGGQTGADRAALDFAIARQIPHGGWCPKGRLATDGVLPPKYLLQETESQGYRQRTKLNVRDSDATLVFNMGALDGGTLQTVRFAQTLNKPHCVIQLDEGITVQVARQVARWIEHGKFKTLNIAGPREEKRPGIHSLVLQSLGLIQTACA